MSRSPRRPGQPLVNPYDVPAPPAGNAVTWSSAALVAATAAGLTLLAGGVAAAEPVPNDDIGTGLGSLDLAFDPPTSSGSSNDGPDALAEPFPTEPDPNVDYRFADDVSITPFSPVEPVFDEPVAGSVAWLPDPTGGLDPVPRVGDATVGTPDRGAADEEQPPAAPEPTVQLPDSTTPGLSSEPTDVAHQPSTQAVPVRPGEPVDTSGLTGAQTTTVESLQGEQAGEVTESGPGLTDSPGTPPDPGAATDGSLTVRIAPGPSGLVPDRTSVFDVDTPTDPLLGEDRDDTIGWSVAEDGTVAILDGSPGLLSPSDAASPDGATSVPAGQRTGTVRSSPGSGAGQASVRFGAGGERIDESIVQAEQAAILVSLGTEVGRRRLQHLLAAERVVTGPDGLDLFVADVAERLRQLAIGSSPLTREQADVLYPVPSQEPLLATMPESMRPTLQAYYDQQNPMLAERAMASRSGFQAPELACWVACRTDGTARVLPELHVGLNHEVSGAESTLDGLDLTDVTDLVGVHTHPLFATADPPKSYDTTGLSAEDIAFLDTLRTDLPPHVEPAVAPVSLLEGTVAVARRGPLPDGAPLPEQNGARGPLRVRVLPSTPGAPVSSDIKIQSDDTGTLDYSLADAVEAPGVSEQRYAAAERAAEVGLDPTALTDPPDLYGPGVLPPGVRTAEGLTSRGLVVAPPVSAVDLPLPSDPSGRSVDPEVEDSGDPSTQLPAPAAVPSRGTASVQTGASSPEAERSGRSSDGTVIRPDPGLPWSEQVRLGLVRAPGAWANEPPDEFPDIAVPDGRPVDPDEFDPNRAQREEPVVPQVWDGPGTFPDGPEVDLEHDVWTFPPLPETAVLPELGTSPAGRQVPNERRSPTTSSAPVAAPISGSPALRPDSRYPLCGSGVSDGCIDPASLRDANGDGVADNAGTLRNSLVGAAIVGPAIVGPAIVGPAIVGPAIVGPAIVGSGYDEAPASAVPEVLTSSPVRSAETGGSQVVPSPALTAPSPRSAPPQPAPEPTWQDRAGQVGEVLWNVLTYPHPLSPRGALGPVIWGPAAAERQLSY